MCVCVCKLFFPSKTSQKLLDLRILKFGTNIRYDKLYCVFKNQTHMAYQSLYLFIFLSLTKFSVTNFSASNSDGVFKCYLHNEDDQAYY